MKHYLWIFVLLFANNFAFSQFNNNVIAQIDLYFDTASHEISTTESNKIDGLLQNLSKSKQNYSFEICGYTDAVGTDTFNKKLSENRASTVSNYFLEKEFLLQNIKILSEGEFFPIASNDSETGRAKNRRVSIKVFEINAKNHINNIVPQEDIYSINNQQNTNIEHDSGTIIHIPENAFVDENRNPVFGNVTVSYIEYREPIDFLLGNIPMDYNQNSNEHTFFNSGGMFKIEAYQNGKKLALDKDKQLKIDFNLADTPPDMNFYQLDEKTKEWKELKKLNPKEFIKDKNYVAEDTTFSEYITVRNYNSCDSTYNNINKGLYFAADSTSLYKAFYSTPRTELVKIKRQIAGNNKKTQAQKLMLQKLQKYSERLNCTLLQQTDSKNLFSLVFTDILLKSKFYNLVWESDNNEVVTELSNQKNIQLKKINTINDTTFDLFFTNEKNQEIVLQNTLLKPKSATQKKIASFAVSNVNILSPISDSSKIQFEKINNSYKKLIAKNSALKKHGSFNKKYFAPESKKVLTDFWQLSKPYMPSDELAMNIDEWFLYFDANKLEMLKRFVACKNRPEYEKCGKYKDTLVEVTRKKNKAEFKAFQQLEISNLGIFNCDQITRLQEPLIVDAGYEDENGATINPIYIYILDKSINGIIRYDGYNGYNPNHFAFSKVNKTNLIAFDNKGNSYICNADVFSKIVQNKQDLNILKLKKIASNNKEDLKRTLDL